MRSAFGCWILALVLFLALALSPTTPAQAWPPTYTEDAYEASGGDDVKASARIITYLMAAAGHNPYTESHTLDAATSAGVCDEDWYRFDVSPDEAAAGITLLFEALANVDRDLDPVMELYGPGLAFTPTPGTSLPPSGTDPVAIAANRRGPWWEHLGASIVFRPTASGTYFIRVRPYGDNSGNGYYDNAGPYTFRAKTGTFTRLSGSNRIQTSVAISKERFADITLRGGMGYFNTHTVVVTNGYNFPDALCGAGLTGVTQGPILLTASAALPAATANELLRIEPDRVYVLGGPAAVSETVVSQIRATFPAWNQPIVERISGSDRIATSVEIGSKVLEIASTGDAPWGGTVPPGLIFLANAYDYPDALSASPVSAARFAPILLNGAATLDSRVLRFIRDHGITDVVIVGGTSAISLNIQTQLTAELGASRVLRLAGRSRYETSKRFATWAAGLPGDTSMVGTPGRPNAIGRTEREMFAVCRGDDFPDALSVAPLCAQGWYARPKPILLTPSNSTSPWLYDIDEKLPGSELSYLEEVWSATGVPRIQRSYIIGGEAAVGAYTFWQLDVQS